MIELESVTFAYPESQPVLSDVSLRVAEGERVVLLGANGCGKTTLLRLLDGLLFPARGRYLYDGIEVTPKTLGRRTFARRFRREVVLLFQQPEAMLFNPTVYDEIAFGLRQLGADDVDGRVRHWAARLGLDGRLDEAPFRLSGGEKQRLCLAALLALEPRVLLLDEPTANLDPRTTGWLIDLLASLPVTVVTATHNLSLAGELGQRMVVLSEQHRIAFDGTLPDLMADEGTLVEANLVHRHGDRGLHTHDWS
ncbi:MAG: ABC transporter ATP-binding protein [Candidatus Dadabacteria bacterium]|nr:MAG: ABC transporter ATP-binding protein [Candidatus Dadabacteria bacterium]